MKIRFMLILLTSICLVHGQSPKSLEHALKILNEECSDSLKIQIRISEPEELPKLFYPWDGDNEVLTEFTSHRKKLRYQKYFKKLGINYNENIRLITLTAFQKRLNNEALQFDSLLSFYGKIDQRWSFEDENRFLIDTIRGIYIPKDILDCFNEIDDFWVDSVRMEVKKLSEEEFTARSHLGFGMWIRNNWQLWRGSRLSKFFNEKGVYHPDSMSWIILLSYHRYLNNKKLRLEEQFEASQGYD